MSIYPNAGWKRPEKPGSESLADTLARVIPYLNEKIVPQVKAGKMLIISAHGNSLRALVKYLDDVSSDEIMGLNIPTGIPLIYELDENARAQNNYYLAEQSELNKAVNEVVNQTGSG